MNDNFPLAITKQKLIVLLILESHHKLLLSGIHHADKNSANFLLGDDGLVHIIDFGGSYRSKEDFIRITLDLLDSLRQDEIILDDLYDLLNENVDDFQKLKLILL